MFATFWNSFFIVLLISFLPWSWIDGFLLFNGTEFSSIFYHAEIVSILDVMIYKPEKCGYVGDSFSVLLFLIVSFIIGIHDILLVPFHP